MSFTIKAKLILLCSVFLLIFIPSTEFFIVNFGKVVNAFGGVVHDTADIVATANNLNKLIVDMETGQRGFIITGKDDFLEPFHKANEDIDKTLTKLRKALADRPEYLDVLEEIEHLKFQWLGVAGIKEIEARRSITQTNINLKTINTMILSGKGKRILDKLRNTINMVSNDFKKDAKKDELLLITRLGKDIVDSETGQRGFLLAGKDRFLEPYYAGQVAFAKNLKELQMMLEGDIANQNRLSELEKLFKEWLIQAAQPEIYARVKYEKNPRTLEDLANLVALGSGKKIIDTLRERLDTFIHNLTKETEQEFLKAKQKAYYIKLIYFLVCGSSIIIAFFLSFYIGRSIITPVNVLISETERIGKGDLTHKIRIKSKDEIGRLAYSFNQMTSKLQETTVSKDYVENVINSMTDFLIIVSPDGNIETVNYITYAILGYEQDELIGKQISHVIAAAEEEEEELFTGIRLAELIKTEAISHVEVIYMAKDGEKIPMALTGSAMRDNGGELQAIVLVGRDTTKTKQLVSELKDFAYIVSHDLKAPLRSIGQLSDWLVNDYTDVIDDEGKKLLGLLKGRVVRMNKLIEGILEYSRIGRIQEEKIEINLGSLIKEVLDLIGLPNHIEVTTCKDLPVIYGEKVLITQLFENLISNAIKYMDKPRGLIKIDCQDKGCVWQFSVADNGMGIDKRYFDKIFKIFQTLSPRDKTESTGIGLTIVKKIIDTMNGKVWIESELEKGSKFFITLPKG
jgi:PAS domain S-box-containing protein